MKFTASFPRSKTMTSKELTTFIVDVGPSMYEGYMEEPGDPPDEKETRLTMALRYYYQAYTQKLIKGRVTDYVTLMTFHSSISSELPTERQLTGVNCVSRRKAPSFDALKRHEDYLYNKSGSGSGSDSFEALLAGIELTVMDTRGSFKRNIVLITNEHAPKTGRDADLYKKLFDDIVLYDINLTIIFAVSNSLDKGNHPLGYDDRIDLDLWMDLSNNFHEKHPSFHPSPTFITSINAVRALSLPIPKKIESRSKFKGKLRFGTNPATINNEEVATNFQFDIEVYPAVVVEKLPSFHNYLVKDSKAEPITTDSSYFIEKDGEKVDVPRNQWDSAYKYTNYSILGLNEEKTRLLQLTTKPGMDILGFISKEKLPIAFFTEESNYVVQSKGLLTVNSTNYLAFCKALIDLNRVAVVRFVPKENSEVSVCALYPLIAEYCGMVYSLQMVRLPYSEDEKIGRFPYLNPETVVKEEGENKTPMEEFVEAISLDRSDDSPEPLAQYYVRNEKILLDHPPLVRKYHYFGYGPDCSIYNPAISKFNKNLHKIIKEATRHEDLHEFLSEPGFVEKYMVDEKETNLFNLRNILLGEWLEACSRLYVNTEPALKLVKTARPYKTLSRRKKVKREHNQTDKYGQEEAEYADLDEWF